MVSAAPTQNGVFFFLFVIRMNNVGNRCFLVWNFWRQWHTWMREVFQKKMIFLVWVIVFLRRSSKKNIYIYPQEFYCACRTKINQKSEWIYRLTPEWAWSHRDLIIRRLFIPNGRTLLLIQRQLQQIIFCYGWHLCRLMNQFWLICFTTHVHINRPTSFKLSL